MRSANRKVGAGCGKATADSSPANRLTFSPRTVGRHSAGKAHPNARCPAGNVETQTSGLPDQQDTMLNVRHSFYDLPVQTAALAGELVRLEGHPLKSKSLGHSAVARRFLRGDSAARAWRRPISTGADACSFPAAPAQFVTIGQRRAYHRYPSLLISRPSFSADQGVSRSVSSADRTRKSAANYPARELG